MSEALTNALERFSRVAKMSGVMVATVESCTGGGIASAITEVAGSSSWFDRGFVTYSNKAKMQLVGVKASTLEAHGAVSEETALEMATGGVEHSDAAAAVSVTGIAGPTGAVPGKPVGTVCFGFAKRTRGGIVCRTETCHFEGDRTAVREATVIHAIEGLAAELRAR